MMDKMAQIRSEKINPGEIGIWWLGQAGYIIKTHRRIICIDPYLSDSGRKISEDFARMVPPPLLPEELICDLFLCTHNHSDHADPETIGRIKNKDSIIFVGPRTVCDTFLNTGIKVDNIVQIDTGKEKEVSGVRIRATFCIPNEVTVLDSVGFIIFLEDNINLYFTGDTAYTDLLGYVANHRIDIMFTCINGKFGNMSIDNSVNLVETIKPKVVIPNHYGMFAINDVDPDKFKQKVKGDGCVILNLGNMYLYRKDGNYGK